MVEVLSRSTIRSVRVGLRDGQLLEGVCEWDTQWLKMTFVGRQYSEAVSSCSSRDGNVLEAWIMGARQIKHNSCMPGFFHPKWQDVPGIKMLYGHEPSA